MTLLNKYSRCNDGPKFLEYSAKNAGGPIKSRISQPPLGSPPLAPNSLGFGRQGEAEGLKGMETSNKNRMDRFGVFQTSTGSIHAYIYQAARANIRLWEGWRAWTVAHRMNRKNWELPPKKEQTKNGVTEHYLVTETDRILGFKILQH